MNSGADPAPRGCHDRTMKSPRRLGALGLVAAVTCAAWFALGFNHSIRDGSKIFSEVQGVRAAVPYGATQLSTRSTPAPWISGCSQIPGSRDGWGTDGVFITFTTSHSRAATTTVIDRALSRRGWRRHDATTGPGQGPVAHWTLNVHSAHRAQAWAYPLGPAAGHWVLSARWQPPGPVGQGCP